MARSSLLSSSPNSPLFSSEVNSLSFIFITRQPPPLLYPPLILRSIHLSSHVPAYKHTHTRALVRLFVRVCQCAFPWKHQHENYPSSRGSAHLHFICMFPQRPTAFDFDNGKETGMTLSVSLSRSFSLLACMLLSSFTLSPSVSSTQLLLNPPFPFPPSLHSHISHLEWHCPLFSVLLI